MWPGFDLETVDEEPPRGNATANSLLRRENAAWLLITVQNGDNDV